jgi:hypothetical protein
MKRLLAINHANLVQNIDNLFIFCIVSRNYTVSCIQALWVKFQVVIATNNQKGLLWNRLKNNRRRSNLFFQ